MKRFAAISALCLWGLSTVVEATPYHCTAKVLLPSYRARETVFTDRVVFDNDESRAWILFWWSEYLHSTHQELAGINIEPDCEVMPADAGAQQARMSAKMTGWKMMQNPVIEVQWSPTKTRPPGEFDPLAVEIFAGHRMNQSAPKPAVTAPPASAIAEPPKKHHYYYCSSEQRPPTMYFSSAFDTPDESPMAMMEGYSKFLAQKYGYHAVYPPSCFGAHGSLAEAQADVQQRMKDLRVAGKWKIVETGWAWGATPPPPRTPLPPGMDPAVDQLPEPFRTWTIKEVPGSRAYCQQTAMISSVFDCDCFARAVVHARIANRANYRTPEPGREDMAGFDPLTNLFYTDSLPCTECVDDARLRKYAVEQTRRSLANVIAQKGESHPSVTRTISCAADRFAADFSAKPSVPGIKGWMNNAISTCFSKHAND